MCAAYLLFNFTNGVIVSDVDSSISLQPCSTCPWRKNRDATTIPRYDHELACELLNTVGEEDAFRPIMACHGSPDNNMRACLGYLAMAGWSNLNVRLLLLRGEIADSSEVAEACEAAGIELESDYQTVLVKLAKSIED